VHAVARFPELSQAGQGVPASIFARLREHLARYTGDVIPLQIGDTHLAPPAALGDAAWHELAPGDLYAYGAPAGWAPIVTAIARKAREHNGIAVTEAGVQLACGATHALACAVQTLCDRGDELILMTPHWPLIKGIAIGHGVVPVEVPFAADLEAALEQAVTPRTSAIYVATPNNPDGAMLSVDDIAVLARVADRHGLWILADEVYEHYGYDRAHVSIATHPLAKDRTITVFSFAKSYAQAGLRVGYAVGPDGVIAAVRKLVNHSVYNVPVAMQRLALAAMQGGDAFLAGARARYQGARERARARLVAPAAQPPGGAYLWVDFSRWSADDCMPVLARIAEHGVLLAPGSAFGESCRAHARLCFTGVDEDRLDEGIDRINRVLESW
jgi:aspartate/methionine/tyrosine aminotransferase